MTLSLTHQMDSVFNHGLHVIQKHEKPVLREWKELLSHMQKTNRHSIKNMERVINFFTDYFFHPQDNFNNGKMASPPAQPVVSLDINQSIITLLENAVHKVVQTTTTKSYTDHQSI
ncbi:hypothetical protein [Lentibacillus sp. CBA3610]|uniref:hypothetical protein n=1 Tax=Lentibacillus sp. CBA3610 TaxID=2518176 RepID=UPI001595CBB1|nr:hypothetical protein [Lentibacillus sp. CBA3610]QKY68756.1 hypothetical protein Len3610_03195 [Lentibacillus sp. CBA3610]